MAKVRRALISRVSSVDMMAPTVAEDYASPNRQCAVVQKNY